MGTLVARGVIQRSGGAALARVSRPRCPGDQVKGPGYNHDLPTRSSEEPKNAVREWASSTSLAKLFPEADLDAFSSQGFWDQMDTLSEEALARIETELVRATLTALGVTLDTLFFDTTNFFTYIDSTNDRTELARRGHSKQHRTDLRQVGLGLLVSREGQLPLLCMVYPGNENDVTCFPKALQLLRQRLMALGLPLEQLTIVFDRGNNSHDNFKLVDEGPNGYVAALSPASVADLRDLPTSSYQTLSGGMLAGLPVYRTRRVVWGAERTILLFISEELLEAQKRGLNQQLAERILELEAWREQLAKAVAKYRTGQYLKDFLKVAFDPEKKGAERLSWTIDDQAKAAIEIHFGKRVLITDRHGWTDEEILSAYRGQSQAEASFRQLKDDDHLALRPQFHWTDQKIGVHAFICLAALLLARSVEHQACQHGWKGCLSTLLDRLAGIRLAMVLQPTKGRPRCTWQLKETDPEMLDLFAKLVPPSAAVCYTLKQA